MQTVQRNAGGRDVRACLDRVTACFEAKRESVIPMLQAVQANLGYLPLEAMRGIAKYLRMPEAAVQAIATFYAQFRFEKPGRHRVTLCRGTACHVRGSARLLDDVQASLGVTPGKTTAGGAVTLETVGCFGPCALAPVVVVDGRVYGRQTPAGTRRMIEGLRREKPAAHSRARSAKRDRGGCR